MLYFQQFQEDALVKKIVNLLTKNGKKSKSEKILTKIFFFIQVTTVSHSRPHDCIFEMK